MAGVKACCIVQYLCPRYCCELPGSKEARRYAIMLLRDKDRVSVSSSLTTVLANWRPKCMHDVMYFVHMRKA